MMPVSFRIPRQKRFFVLKWAGNLTASYFGKKNKKMKRRNNQPQHWVFLPESDFIRHGFCSLYPQVSLPQWPRAAFSSLLSEDSVLRVWTRCLTVTMALRLFLFLSECVCFRCGVHTCTAEL